MEGCAEQPRHLATTLNTQPTHVLVPALSWPRIKAEVSDLPIIAVMLDEDGQLVTEDGSPAPGEIHIAWQNFEVPRKQARVFTQLMLESDALAFVQTAAAGLDAPIFARLAEKGIRLCNSDAQATSIAEFVMASILNVFHDFGQRRALQAERSWADHRFEELAGKHCVLVGYGAIGSRIAQRLAAFDARISVIRRRTDPLPGIDRVGTLADLDHYVSDADVIVLAASLNASTQHILDGSTFARCKAGCVVVNIARGAMIDEAALLQALDRELVAHAILDVFETEPLPESSPLWAHDRVSVSAHASSLGSGRRARGDELFTRNLRAYLTGASLHSEVDTTALLDGSF